MKSIAISVSKNELRLQPDIGAKLAALSTHVEEINEKCIYHPKPGKLKRCFALLNARTIIYHAIHI